MLNKIKPARIFRGLRYLQYSVENRSKGERSRVHLFKNFKHARITNKDISYADSPFLTDQNRVWLNVICFDLVQFRPSRLRYSLKTLFNCPTLTMSAPFCLTGVFACSFKLHFRRLSNFYSRELRSQNQW